MVMVIQVGRGEGGEVGVGARVGANKGRGLFGGRGKAKTRGGPGVGVKVGREG